MSRDGDLPGAEEALGLRADVVAEDGQFAVYVDVVLVSGAVRKRIGVWPDRRRAEIAAREIQRQAGRHISSPPSGGSADS